ncbi:hypothetical protein JXA80_13060 [bacterium]|nr:hypothetical protein [candidate division CSSED10-310 bacterium]
MENRLQLKIVKRIAVLGAVLGLILVWTGVRLREIPRVSIGAIDIQYNMALARITGTVLDISVNEAKDSFHITVDDGTGRIRLTGFGKYARFREAMGKNFPQIGDSITAVGNLSISESWGTSMFLASPHRLTLVARKTATASMLGSITRDDVDHTATFSGRITTIRLFNSGRSISLEDDTGSIDLIVFDTERATMDPAIAAALDAPGATIRFNGRVTTYRDSLQLRLVKPEIPGHFELLEPTAEHKDDSND